MKTGCRASIRRIASGRCNIKGKYAVRARVTGNTGIYHLQTCRSYPGLDQDRWFCSEDDALAAGFRKAYNCRRSLPAK